MDDPEFVVVGESVADVIRTADGVETTYAGGSPMNVAHGLARLGRAVTLVTELGADQQGRVIRDHLSSSGVVVATGRSNGRRTPSALAVIQDDGAANYTFDISWELPEIPPGAAGEHLHCGSIGAFLDPGAATVASHLAAHRNVGTTSFDPNLRPALLGARAEVRARTEQLVALSDIVKASDEDLDWLYPRDSSAAVMARWLSLGPALVVITAGGEGAAAVSSLCEVNVEAVAVEVSDTVGAGDAFMAALLDGLASADLLGGHGRSRLRHASAPLLQAVLARAALAASITVGRPGADPPTRQELSPTRF